MAMSAVATCIALAAVCEASVLPAFFGPQDSYLASSTKDNTHRSALLKELGINNNMQDNPGYPDRAVWANFSALETQLLAAAGPKGIRGTQTYYYINLVDRKKPQRICITGFENGVSTAALLSAAPAGAHVDSFDVAFPEQAVQILNNNFPNRLTMHVGDTSETVPDHLTQCDMVIADGSQIEEGAFKEIANFQKNSISGNTILISDDTFDCDSSKEHCAWDCISCDCEKKPFCNAKSKAWKKAVQQGIITQISCKPAYWSANQEKRDYPVGYCFGKYVATDPGHNSISLI